MASSLQEQLQKIAAAAGIATGRQPRGKASLLHTYQEAADIGLQDIYEVAVQGMSQFARFRQFTASIFMDPTSQNAELSLFPCP